MHFRYPRRSRLLLLFSLAAGVLALGVALGLTAAPVHAQASEASGQGLGPDRVDGFIQIRFTRRLSDDDESIRLGDADTDARGLSGNFNTFKVRQARIGARGQIGARTDYRLQINAGSSTGGPRNVSVNQAYITLRDLPSFSDDVTWQFRAGLQPNPFGFHLRESPTARSTPERYIGFSGDGSGLFRGQDYDLGAAVLAELGPLGRLDVGLFNGQGETAFERSPRKDVIGRLGLAEPIPNLHLGVSGYYGNGAVEADEDGSEQRRTRNMVGFDARYLPETGPQFTAEYLRGRGGQVGARTLPSVYRVDALREFVDDTPVEAYFVEAGYAFTPTLRAVAAYDYFNRNTDGAGVLINGIAAERSDFVESRVHAGVLYTFAERTRLRLWYEQPLNYPNVPGGADPIPRAGLFTAELQVTF